MKPAGPKIVLAMLLAGAAFAQTAATKPRYEVRRVTPPITIDGNVEATEWSTASPAIEFIFPWCGQFSLESAKTLSRGSGSVPFQRFKFAVNIVPIWGSLAVDGTINMRGDKDRGWRMKMAIPWENFAEMDKSAFGLFAFRIGCRLSFGVTVVMAPASQAPGAPLLRYVCRVVSADLALAEGHPLIQSKFNLYDTIGPIGTWTAADWNRTREPGLNYVREFEPGIFHLLEV